MSKVKDVRTRIAPSPTGFAHVGTAYAALFNWAYARKNKGSFVLRFEDSDIKRNVPGAEEAVFTGLSWLGIEWDEGPDKGGSFGPYRISEKIEAYQKRAKQLLEQGSAYEEEGAIRFKNTGEDTSWEDLIRGKITFPGGEVTDFVLLKSDGYPTYNFAVVVDDIDMKISHVIRGEEHISNTPRQLALYKAFDKEPPEFAHFPTLRNTERKKLSKRLDPVDLWLYRKQGYLPEALSNFLCLLGWSHPEGKEIFSLEEFMEHFSLDRIRKAGPIFDTKKLDWLNGEYIRKKSDDELAHLLNEHIAADVELELLEKTAPLVRERIHRLSEAPPLLEFFWEEPQLGKSLFDQPGLANRHIASAVHALGAVKKWSLEEINASLEKEIAEKGFKTGDFYMSLRLALSGKKVTPPINESMVILGQDKVLHRLSSAEKVLLEVEPPEIA